LVAETQRQLSLRTPKCKRPVLCDSSDLSLCQFARCKVEIKPTPGLSGDSVTPKCKRPVLCDQCLPKRYRMQHRGVLNPAVEMRRIEGKWDFGSALQHLQAGFSCCLTEKELQDYKASTADPDDDSKSSSLEQVEQVQEEDENKEGRRLLEGILEGEETVKGWLNLSPPKILSCPPRKHAHAKIDSRYEEKSGQEAQQDFTMSHDDLQADISVSSKTEEQPRPRPLPRPPSNQNSNSYLLRRQGENGKHEAIVPLHRKVRAPSAAAAQGVHRFTQSHGQSECGYTEFCNVHLAADSCAKGEEEHMSTTGCAGWQGREVEKLNSYDMQKGGEGAKRNEESPAQHLAGLGYLRHNEKLNSYNGVSHSSCMPTILSTLYTSTILRSTVCHDNPSLEIWL
jgi:hypothetical protein